MQCNQVEMISSDEDIFEVRPKKIARANSDMCDDLFKFESSQVSLKSDSDDLFKCDSEGDIIIEPGQSSSMTYQDVQVEVHCREFDQEIVPDIGHDQDLDDIPIANRLRSRKVKSVENSVVDNILEKVVKLSNSFKECVSDEVKRYEDCVNRHLEKNRNMNERATLKHFPEFERHRYLLKNVADDEEMAIKWIRKEGFIPEDGVKCPDCTENGRSGKLKYIKISRSQRRKGNVILQCTGEGNKCRKKYSPFRGTFFDGVSCKIPVHKAVELVYYLAKKYPVNKTAEEVDVHENTVIDYFNYCREVCTVATQRRGDAVIGGVNKTVEIDESKFFKRKYNRGRILGSQKDGWVFGGICRETKEVFMIRVKDRTRATLYEAIKKHILPGTTIISDEWAAYKTLEEEGFQHQTICHKRNFVDPLDKKIHTQNIENQWRYANKNYPDNSTSESQKDSYLQEYLYRKKHGNRIMDQIPHGIKEVYPW